MSNKGQLLSQPFMYLFYAIAALLILFFGVRMLLNLNDLGEDVKVKDFVINFDSRVQDVYSDNYGSVASLDRLNIPNTIQEICVIDFEKDKNFENVEIDKFKSLLELKEGTTQENFALYGDNIDGKIQFFKIDNLETGSSGNPTCDLVERSKVNIKLSNRGDKVIVVKVS